MQTFNMFLCEVYRHRYNLVSVLMLAMASIGVNTDSCCSQQLIKTNEKQIFTELIQYQEAVGNSRPVEGQSEGGREIPRVNERLDTRENQRGGGTVRDLLNRMTINDNDEIFQDDEATINIGQRGTIDLQALVQWASELEGFELLLDDESFLRTQNRVVFFSRVKINRKTLLWLVQEVLRANGFALIDAGVPGWKRVASLADVPPLVPAIESDQIDQPTYEFVTAIFALQHVSPEVAKTYLEKAMPTKQPNSYRALEETRMLLVTDMVRNIRQVEKMLGQIDVPAEETQVEFYQVRHMEAKELSDQLEMILGTQQEMSRLARDDRASTEGLNPLVAAGLSAASVKVSFDGRTNRLVLIGRRVAIEELRKLIADLDVPIGLELRTYQFNHVSATRIDELVKRSLSGAGEEIERIYRSTVDSQSNQLVVTAGSTTHERIEALKSQLDRVQQIDQERSPMKFYKLKNVRVVEVVGTIQSIERSTLQRRLGGRVPQTGIRGREGFGIGGPNVFSTDFREGPPPLPPNFSNFGNFQGGGSVFPQSGLGGTLNFDDRFGATDEAGMGAGMANLDAVLGRDVPQRLIPGEAQITIDENTNTLIVVAEPEVQMLYAELVRRLDVRRPQVLIEAHVVLIEGSDNLNLGVEISGGDRQGEKRLFAFSSFGLSEVDAISGALRISPGLGFNGTLVDPDTADVVIRALATHNRSRVVSSPKVVVDDNATGLLSSVAEQPFASVNATQTVATTTFAGFAQAGTTINVTPRISDDDYLNLDFDILVNTFTGTPAPNLPPPRNTDQIVSQVTIPDGYTVIVGGLNRQRISRTIAGLPFIERVPILRHLASSKEHEYSDGMLYIFIKPTILRDDLFRDMIYLSGDELYGSGTAGDFPESVPQLIR